MTFEKRIEGFFFRRDSASGLGMARILWAGVALLFFLMQRTDIVMFYSDEGLLPRNFLPLVVRGDWYFSVLEFAGDPATVYAIYTALLVSLFMSMVGILPRLSTIVSFVLMCSFHERNMFVLGGGDTVLRALGFILCVSPGISALSFSRLRKQWDEFQEMQTFLKPVQSYAWTYRLILCQAAVIYLISLWWKLTGSVWEAGTATEIALHHPLFSRWPSFAEELLPVLPLITYATLVFEACWILLLLPRKWRPVPLKLAVLGAGVFFHLSIFILMDAGSFSLAMMAMYAGLLQGEDIIWLKKILSRRKKRIIVLFDGDCGLCIRSMFVLSLADWLKRLTWRNFRDVTVQKKEAAELKLPALKKEIHVLIKKDVYKGFFAFRALSWQLPSLWLLTPFLYIPGVPWIGKRVYAQIAARRAICKHKDCML